MQMTRWSTIIYLVPGIHVTEEAHGERAVQGSQADQYTPVKLLQLNRGGWHLFQLMMWSTTWLEVGRKYVRTVPMMAVSLPSCTIDQGQSIDLMLEDSTSSTVRSMVAWCTSDVREPSDMWSEWSLLTTDWRCHKTCSADGWGSWTRWRGAGQYCEQRYPAICKSCQGHSNQGSCDREEFNK